MCITPNNAELKKIKTKPDKIIKAYKVLSRDGNSIYYTHSGIHTKQRNRWGPGYIFPNQHFWNGSEKPISFKDINNVLKTQSYTTKGLYFYRTLRDAKFWRISPEKIIVVYINPKDVVFATKNTLVCCKAKIEENNWKKVFKENRKPIARFV